MKRILFVYLALTISCLNLFAQNKVEKSKTIVTSGTAEAEVVPDEIFIQITLKEYDKRSVGKITIETLRANFLQMLKSLNIADKDVEIQSYGGGYGYSFFRRKNPDMKASISYLVKLNKLEQIDALVDKLDDEATQSFSIANTSYSKATELKKELELQAIKKAKEKAVYLADAINEKVGKAITISTSQEIANPNSTFISQANLYNVSYMSKGGEGKLSGDINIKKLKYQYTINTEFELL